MALRDIKIPFGPDKTGGNGYGFFNNETESDPDGIRDPFAAPQSSDQSVAQVTEQQGSDQWDSWQSFTDVPAQAVDDASPDAYRTTTSSEQRAREGQPLQRAQHNDGSQRRIQRTSMPQPLPKIEASYDAEEMDEYPLDYDDLEQNDHDVHMSFAALKDSFGQSRELKARDKEMEEFRARLEEQQQELDDRDYILQNYEMLVSEQKHIIDECTRQREANKESLAHATQQIEQISAELENAKEYHATQMQPLQTEIGRAKAAADQAKNDERSRKSELNAAESEVRHAASANDAAVAQAKYDHIKQAYDQACGISEDAQANLDDLQRIYDDAVHQIEQVEGPLEHSIRDLQEEETALKESIAQLGEDISVARKRLQYCEGVKLYPEETEKLRQEVQLDEQDLQDMQEEYDLLNDQLELSKSKARKAKMTLGLGIAVVVIFVIVLLFIFLH